MLDFRQLRSSRNLRKLQDFNEKTSCLTNCFPYQFLSLPWDCKPALSLPPQFLQQQLRPVHPLRRQSSPPQQCLILLCQWSTHWRCVIPSGRQQAGKGVRKRILSIPYDRERVCIIYDARLNRERGFGPSSLIWFFWFFFLHPYCFSLQ